MQYLTKLFVLSMMILTLISPVFVLAQAPDSGLVPCGTIKDDTGKVTNPCGFSHVLTLINNVVNFMLFVMAIPIGAIMIFYAGFLLVFSGGEVGKMNKAKGIFFNVLAGLAFAVAAWLIVHTILDLLGYDASWVGF